MVIALIHWKIKPDMVDAFLDFWCNEAVVQDREGLIGEFLSAPCDMSELPWITWDLAASDGAYRSFVNVGLWRDAEDFQDQIGKYFNRDAAPKAFEYERRRRTILRPQCWRIGESGLPVQDHGFAATD